MSTKLSNTDRYPATPAQIMAMLQDPEYAPAKYQALGDIKFSVLEHSPSDGSLTVKVEREVDAGLPGAAKKVLGETNHLVQSENWVADGGGFAADMDIDSPGKPMKITATETIVPAGDAEADWTVIFDIKASIPLIGGKIERMVQDQTKESLVKEFEFNKGYLASH